jgi:hypothetical protein
MHMAISYTNAELSKLPEFSRMVGLTPPDDFHSNGCTLAPDVIFGRDLRCAAHWHDYGYLHGGSEWDRYADDRNFLENLRRSGLTGRWGWLAWLYYYRVRLWGHWYFRYDGDPPKRNIRFWLTLLVGRYIQW